MRLLLLLVAAVVMVDALVGEQGALAGQRARRDQMDMTARLARTRAQNALRREEVERLLHDPSALEDAARRLGLIHRGEKVFILKDLPSPTK